MGSERKSARSLSDLSRLLGQETRRTDSSAPSSTRAEYVSARVDNSNQAGRAPYNFVPAPAVVKSCFDPPPPQNRYQDDRYTGELDLQLTALTDFYIRGMWPLRDFVNGRKEIKEQKRPFSAGGRLRLPGSSLRGMLRTLIEILGKAPLAPINNNRLFFRSVGASSEPADPSFDPNAVSYKERLCGGDGTRANPSWPKANAGYLYAGRRGWYVRPARRDSYGTQWYRINLGCVTAADPEPIVFQPAEAKPYQHSRVWARFGMATKASDEAGGQKGVLIQSGGFAGKKKFQWVIHEEDENGAKIVIPPELVESYLSDRNSGANLKYREEGQPKGKPCFFTTAKDDRGNEWVTSFGHTPYYRLPYRTTPEMANPAHRSESATGWDLAELLFGRLQTKERSGARGRVFVEDAFLTGDGEIDERETVTVLGTPQPTTYQHYLVQRSPDGRQSIHWDANYDKEPRRPFLRGHKLYWHRPGASTTPTAGLEEKKKVTTTFYKARKKCKFEARIRFENLSRLELGALLTAIELPSDCAHRLGMAKPLGLGSFRITTGEPRLTAAPNAGRQDRYSKLFDSATQLHVGQQNTVGVKADCKRHFAEWYLFENRREDSQAETLLWQDDRLRELKAILTWQEFDDEPPEARERWLARTRYLAFGTVKNYNHDKPYNEYQKIGYAEGKDPQPGIRRPLPPASQVLQSDERTPSDSAPPFLSHEELQQLRGSHKGGPHGGRSRKTRGNRSRY